MLSQHFKSTSVYSVYNLVSFKEQQTIYDLTVTNNCFIIECLINAALAVSLGDDEMV